MRDNIDSVEKIRFMRFAITNDSMPIDRELDRLSNKIRHTFISSFIKENICAKTVEMFNEAW